jgi:hypothetical protein
VELSDRDSSSRPAPSLLDARTVVCSFTDTRFSSSAFSAAFLLYSLLLRFSSSPPRFSRCTSAPTPSELKRSQMLVDSSTPE